MSSAEGFARARAKRVVAFGRRLAAPGDPLGVRARAGLVPTSGLSLEGVDLALSEHLETHPAPAELDLLLASVGSAPACHVVLSAQVCTAALRALALAVATAPAVVVKPSRRDPVLAALLVEALAADPAFLAAEGTISLSRAREVDPRPGDELHVYGSDESIAALTARLAPGVVVRAHGSGLGLAVVSASASLEEAAFLLARDVVPFDQRGCLSPRFALVEGGAPRAEDFASALDDALASAGRRVPRGLLDDDDRHALALYAATMEAVGSITLGPHHAVGFDPAPRALTLPPAARVVHVVPLEARDAVSLVAPLARLVTTLGRAGDGALAEAVSALAPGARLASLGAMQRPPLDGPVDRRHG